MNRYLANVMLYPYYYGAWSMRMLANARRCAEGRAPVIVLFYHRVADEHLNAWSLSNRRFAQQIQWLRRRFSFVSLHEAQERIASGANDRPVVSITFDDGYADNSAFALPLLIRHRIPFTYFVSVQHVQYGESFAHDLRSGQSHRVNTVEELRALARAGVEIGLHTRTHADLGKVYDPDVLHDELVTAGRDLSLLVERPIHHFAFPYGQHANLSVEAFRVAKEAGYRSVCSAYGGYNFPGDDPFHLQRIHADPEWIRWKNALSIDPRKIANTKRFEYLKELSVSPSEGRETQRRIGGPTEKR